MAGLAGILGNPILEQILLYQVLGQLIGPALAPFAQAITNSVWTAEPLIPLPPADAAMAVIRNLMPVGAAADEAIKSGINPDRFATLVGLAGDAPAPEAMAVALRRGLVDEGRYLTGIRQGRLRDEWAELVKALAVNEPSPGDAMTAVVEGQLDEATGRAKFAAFGGCRASLTGCSGPSVPLPRRSRRPTWPIAASFRGMAPAWAW